MSDSKIACKLVTGQHFKFTFKKTFKSMKGAVSLICMFQQDFFYISLDQFSIEIKICYFCST